MQAVEEKMKELKPLDKEFIASNTSKEKE